MPDRPGFAIVVDSEPRHYVGRHRRPAGHVDTPPQTPAPQTVDGNTHVTRNTDVSEG